MNQNISKIEFYRRVENILPGEELTYIDKKSPKTDIFFENFSMSGLEEMHRYSIDERLYEFFEFKPFVNINETKAYIEKLLGRMAVNAEDRNSMYWFIRRKSDNYLIGTAGLVNLNYGRSSVEWGYGVDPELWGKGYILQIQELLKYYVFSILELNRLDGTTMIHNERTIASLRAAGMKEEGILRQFYCKDDVFIDGWKYSMLRKDYLEQFNNYGTTTSQFSSKEVISIISSVLEDDDISEESTMFNTVNWDSLNHMAIMTALFEKTKINFSPIQISNATSVLSITQLVNGKLLKL
jgi:ribosomal-protein-alanine N-acetyltransferase